MGCPRLPITCVLRAYTFIKGTTPLSGAEWLKDATLTKTNAKAFLFGQSHQGFYDMLFPDSSAYVAYSPYGMFEVFGKPEFGFC